MPVASADVVQIAIVEESTYGVTPATPVFLIIRTTGEGLAFAPTSTRSNEMNATRQVTDSILTGGQSTGELNFELAYEPWFNKLLEGAFCKAWATDVLKIGTVLKSYTIEKKIPVPGGSTYYHRYTGCLINTMSLNIRPNAPITGSFGILGKALEPSEAIVAGATYTDPTLSPVMTAPRVVDIEIDGVAAVSKCFNGITLTLNNNDRAVECIGTLGPKEMVLGRAETQAQFQVLFNSNDLIEILVDQTEISLAFTTEDTAAIGSPPLNNGYEWFLPRVKFTANPVVAGGTNQDVINNVTAEGLLDSVTGTELMVTRAPAA